MTGEKELKYSRDKKAMNEPYGEGKSLLDVTPDVSYDY